MVNTLQGNLRARGTTIRTTLASGLKWGLIGGLAGTAVMDLILMAVLLVVGSPVFTCFSIVGNTAARFFSIHGIELAGGVPMGAAAHYLLGPLIGAIFGVVVTKVKALRVDTLTKCIAIAVVYVEILSQPILATTPILLTMTTTETLQWFGGSFAMHLIWGVIVGGFVSHGLRLTTAKTR